MAAKAKTVYFWNGSAVVKGTVKNMSGSVSSVTLSNGRRKNILTVLLGRTEDEARNNYFNSPLNNGGV